MIYSFFFSILIISVCAHDNQIIDERKTIYLGSLESYTIHLQKNFSSQPYDVKVKFVLYPIDALDYDVYLNSKLMCKNSKYCEFNTLETEKDIITINNNDAYLSQIYDYEIKYIYYSWYEDLIIIAGLLLVIPILFLLIIIIIWCTFKDGEVRET